MASDATQRQLIRSTSRNAWTLLEGVEQAIEPYRETSKVLLVNWWDQVGPDDIERIFGGTFPGWETEHA